VARAGAAYDLASFRRDMVGKDAAVCDAFLRGYMDRRERPAGDRVAIPLFVALHELMHMGIPVIGRDQQLVG